VEQEWQRVDSVVDDNEWAAVGPGGAGMKGGEGEEGEEEWECIVCAKSFRSEAAWRSHERSRKHLKEVER
jgi:DnaJ family protein A protein 5